MVEIKDEEEIEPMSYHRRVLKEMVAKKIAGDILYSSNIGLAMKKWREYFGVKQSELAKMLGISASVISDYESGRRRSPGSYVLKRFIQAIIAKDEETGGNKLKVLAKSMGIGLLLSSVIDMAEMTIPVELEKFIEWIDGELIVPGNTLIHGYTVIDSIRAIENLSGTDFMKLFGSSTERALIFTRVGTGRSPMVALKVFDIRPSLVVLHGLKPDSVDRLGIRLAEIMGVPLAVSKMESVRDMVESLRKRLE